MSADPPADIFNTRLCSLFAAHVNIAIISVADVLKSSAFQFLIEFVQIDICQQRRKRPALRRTFLGADFTSIWQDDPYPQEPPNELEHPFIPYDATHLRHEDVVVHMIEELGDVHVHHPSLPSRACLCAASIAPCALRPGRNRGCFAEDWLEQRLHHLPQQLLREAVQHVGDA